MVFARADTFNNGCGCTHRLRFIAITLSTIGDQLLNKNELTLSLAKDFSSAFSIGLRTRYSLLQIDHQTKGWVEADIGTQIHFSNAVSVAFQLLNH